MYIQDESNCSFATEMKENVIEYKIALYNYIVYMYTYTYIPMHNYNHIENENYLILLYTIFFSFWFKKPQFGSLT